MKNFILIIALIVVQISSQGQNRRTSTSTTVKKSTPSSTKSSSTKTSSTSSTSTSSESESKSSSSSSGEKSFLSPGSEIQGMSTNLEFGAYPSDADVSFINIYGHMGLNFDIKRIVYVGPYFQYKILSTMDHQQISENGTMYDLSSFNEWGMGISTGTYIKASNAILITPELRIGYNEYNMQTDTFDINNKAFLNHKFVNFTPRLNFGFKLSDYTILNFNGGYIFPLYLGGAVKTAGYNPNTFSYGVGLRFYLSK